MDRSIEHLAFDDVNKKQDFKCTWDKYIKHYGFLIYSYSKLWCMFVQASVPLSWPKVTALQQSCLVSIHYESVMFYSTGPRGREDN